MAKILFITLSNIGDCILTLPVLDLLMEKYPSAEFSVIVGPRAKEIFENNPFIKKIMVYDKKSRLGEKLAFIKALRKEEYDLAADLRNTMIPFLLGVKRLSRMFTAPGDILHMKDRHLWKISAEGARLPDGQGSASGGKNAKHFFQGSGDRHNAYGDYAVIAPGARSHLKRWGCEGFSAVCAWLINRGINVVLAGDILDKGICDEIASRIESPVVNLAGKTTLAQLAELISGCRLVISCDSACLHLASYLNLPVLAIFGPTDEEKYGPWPGKSIVIKKEMSCRPCEKSQCKFGDIRCLGVITIEEVIKALEGMLR